MGVSPSMPASPQSVFIVPQGGVQNGQGYQTNYQTNYQQPMMYNDKNNFNDGTNSVPVLLQHNDKNNFNDASPVLIHAGNPPPNSSPVVMLQHQNFITTSPVSQG